MEEIEVKILNIDGPLVEAKLKTLGAKMIFEGLVDTHFFDFENKKLGKKGVLARVRMMGDKTYFTVKKRISDELAKIREEFECEISDFNELISAFSLLGLNETYSFKKKRISYVLEGVHFELDKFLGSYAFVPEFLEIEARDIETIYKFAIALGFKKEDCKPYSVADIVKEIKEKQNGI
jgi:predicted adenylyl cyclase CyaB